MPTIYDSDEQTMIDTEVCGLENGTTSCASRTEGLPALDSRREKIVIRARCKEYVTKQRTVRRTLACFSQPDDVQDTVIGEGAEVTPTLKKNKNKNKIREGRIEKTISIHEQEGKLTKASVTDYRPEIYACPCSGSDSTTCKLCAFLRLADKFCAIVIARQDAIDRSGLASTVTME